MKIAVQKYGGSSVATLKSRETVCEKIISKVNEGYAVAVVLSAMGRKPDPLSTDALIDSVAFKSDLSLAEKDLIMSTGENYSCIQMACLLRKKGFAVKVFCGSGAGIVTDCNNGSAKIVKIYPSNILESLSAGKIVLISGFQGRDESGNLTTLGRGGSDTSAVAIACALKAECAEIYTDVDGVMTCDPKIYSGAKIMELLDISEMGEMANEGAKVLHTRCAEIAEKHNICIYVKNTFSDHQGTKITRALASKKIISGLIHRTGITDIYVDFSDCENVTSGQSLLFYNMAQLGVSLDLINIHTDKLYFSVANEDFNKTADYLSRVGLFYKFKTNKAKISCVGAGMKGSAGVMLSVYSILHEEKIIVYRSVDSFINISCLIDAVDLNRAIHALHRLC